MAILRISLEWLLSLALALIRAAFLLQAVAFGCAWLAVAALAPVETPGWMRDAALSSLLVSAGFGAAGIAMALARGWQPPVARADAAQAHLWPALLGLSLAGFAALAARATADLAPLAREIATQLVAIGFGDALATPAGPWGGILLLPILLALGIPALVAAAAFASIALPLALLALLATRSTRFPVLLAMAAIAQTALVLGGWFVASGFEHSLADAVATLSARDAAEVLPVAEMLQRMARSLVSIARALLTPLLGTLAWLAFLVSSAEVLAFFSGAAAPEVEPR